MTCQCDSGRWQSYGAAEPADRPLVTTRVKFPPPERSLHNTLSDDELAARRRVYDAREIARPMHRRGSNPAKCDRVRIHSEVQVRRRENGGYYLRGLVTCGAVWTCPVCSWKIAIGRGQELQSLIDAHTAKGGGVYLITATLPHDLGDRLKEIGGAVSSAWKKVISGRPWLRMKSQIGLVGFVRARETTVGINGWHPHLHILFFTRKSISDAISDVLREFLFLRWSAAVEAAGYRPPSREHGLTIEHGQNAGHYVAKVSSGLVGELSRGVTKVGRSGSRTPLQVLEDIGKHNRPADRALWEEWLFAMHGARQLTFSRGLKKLYLLDPEISDQDLAESPLDGSQETDELILTLPADMWDRAVRRYRGFAWSVLFALLRGGPEQLYSDLDIFFHTGKVPRSPT